MLVILGAAAPVLAQPRVHRNLIPDLDFAEAVAPEGGRTFDWNKGPRALWQGAAEAGQADGGSGRLGVSGKLRWGERLERDTLMRMRSAIRWRPGESGVLAGLEGTHELEARFGFGEPTRHRWGVELGVDGRVEHTGGATPALRPADRGPGALFAGGVGVEGAMRLTNRATGADAVGLTFPVGARLESLDYLDPGAAVAGTTTDTLHAAIAYQMYDRHALDGRVTMISLSRSRTRFEPGTLAAARLPAVPLPPRPTGRELALTELRVGELDVTFFDDGIMAGMRAHYGWAWMSEPGTERADNLFTFHYGVHVANDGTRFGIGLGRNPEHTPDGRRLLADWRLEIEGSRQIDTVQVAAGLGASWLDDVEHDEAPTLGRYSLDTEAFAPLGAGLELGLYHITSYEPRAAPGASFDPWLQRQGWAVETGLFLRARGGE